MRFPRLQFQRQPLLFVLVTAAAAAGALAVAAVFARRLRQFLAGRPLLTDRSALYTVVLQKRQSLTHNVRLFRFALPGRKMHRNSIAHKGHGVLALDHGTANAISLAVWPQWLGLRPCQHVYLHARIGGRAVLRPYTPVSPCDQRGSFDLMIKVYGPSASFPSGGLMSTHLDSLKPGDSIQVQGPKGPFTYCGRGQFVLRSGRRPRTATQLGLVAAGTGVTPMLQLLRFVLADARDNTCIVLVDVNSSEDDIIAHAELENIAREFNDHFRIWHVLSKMPASDAPANFIQGRLTAGILAEHLPPPSPSTLVLCCGPPLFISDVCRPALAHIGHKAEQVLFF
ncbi:NADH-cytochrome b5 reductase 3-like [Haemaphysalis longicornis]